MTMRDPQDTRSRRRGKVVHGNGPPGHLQRQVLRVLLGARLLIVEQEKHCTPIGLVVQLGQGLTAREIARVLTDVQWRDGVQRLTPEPSVNAALSGMMVCGGRYWIAKHPHKRWSITKNGRAWL